MENEAGDLLKMLREIFSKHKLVAVLHNEDFVSGAMTKNWWNHIICGLGLKKHASYRQLNMKRIIYHKALSGSLKNVLKIQQKYGESVFIVS